MSRIHMVVIQCDLLGCQVETRVLVCVNSARTAVMAALKKVCPSGVVQQKYHDISGATATSEFGLFTVTSVKSIKPSDVLTLSTYFPIHVPVVVENELVSMAQSCRENQEELSCRC